MLDQGQYPERFDNIKIPKLTQRRKKGFISWEVNYEKMDSWTRNRVRFHMTGEQMLDLEDPGRTVAYHLYRRSLLAAGKEKLIKKYKLDERAQNVEDLQALSGWAKKKGPDADVDWRYLVDLHRLNDFIKPPDIDEFKEDIRDWVQRRVKHEWNGDEEEWYKRYEKTNLAVLMRSGRMPDKIITVDEFIQNGDLWCTSGSGFEPDAEKLKIYDKKRNVTEEVKKNKWSVRWGLSNYKTKRLLFKKRKQICKAVQKSEPAKVRAVISSDLGLYLKMTYVSTFLENILRGRQDSTLWMSADDRNGLWQKMAYDGTWRMPLDQSEFDKNVTLRQVLITIKNIKKCVKYYGADDTILEIMDLIEYALDGGYVLVGDERIDIKNGVLSGWRWTALLDTLVNLTELDMAQDWVRENSGIDPGVVALNAQGDDDWLKLKTRQGGIALWLAYESFGLGVNPGKFFLDTRRDEYLRRVMDKNVITGYPARSVASICFRNPVSEKETVGAGRVRSSFGKWKLFAERSDITFYDSWFYRKFLQDCVQGTKGLTKEIVESYVNLSSLAGGIGLDGGRIYSTEIPGNSMLEPADMDILGEGYKEWMSFSERYGVKNRSANAFAVSTLDLSGKYGWPKWVKYVVTDLQLSDDMPHGLLWDRPGSIAIGRRTFRTALAKHIRWFKTVTEARTLSHYRDDLLDQSTLPDLLSTEIKIPLSKYRTVRLETIPGISRTLAQLSDEPDLVWRGLDMSLFKLKPKRWVKDFFSGRLSTATGPISGWGLDVTGHISKNMLNTAINIFLSTRAPSYRLWNSLLAAINAAVPEVLKTYAIRVVE